MCLCILFLNNKFYIHLNNTVTGKKPNHTLSLALLSISLEWGGAVSSNDAGKENWFKIYRVVENLKPTPILLMQIYVVM